MIISIGEEKSFEKVQHSFIIKRKTPDLGGSARCHPNHLLPRRHKQPFEALTSPPPNLQNLSSCREHQGILSRPAVPGWYGRNLIAPKGPQQPTRVSMTSPLSGGPQQPSSGRLSNPYHPSGGPQQLTGMSAISLLNCRNSWARRSL